MSQDLVNNILCVHNRMWGAAASNTEVCSESSFYNYVRHYTDYSQYHDRNQIWSYERPKKYKKKGDSRYMYCHACLHHRKAIVYVCACVVEWEWVEGGMKEGKATVDCPHFPSKRSSTGNQQLYTPCWMVRTCTWYSSQANGSKVWQTFRQQWEKGDVLI